MDNWIYSNTTLTIDKINHSKKYQAKCNFSSNNETLQVLEWECEYD
jgi:hypothetical protein